MCRGRRELNQGAAAKRAERKPADGRDSVDEAGATRRVRWVQVDQGRAQGRKRNAGGDPLRDPRDEEADDIAGEKKGHEGKAFQRDRGAEHRAATDVIGERTDGEERADQAEDIHREDDGECRGRKAPRLLVDDIQRRGRARRRGEEHEDRARRRESGRGRKAARWAGLPIPRLDRDAGCADGVYFPASSRRAAATMSALVLACPLMPHPPSGDSVIRTHVRSLSSGSPPAAATSSVSSRTTPSCLSRSRTPIGVRTWTRTELLAPATLDTESAGRS